MPTDPHPLAWPLLAGAALSLPYAVIQARKATRIRKELDCHD